MGTIFGREPAAIAAALAIAINLAVALVNALVVAVLALVVRQSVTPVSDPKLAVGTTVTTPTGGTATVQFDVPPEGSRPRRRKVFGVEEV